MIAVRISLQGCDDSTIWNLLVTKQQLEFLRLLEAESHERSGYSCQPVLVILESDE